MKKAFYVLTVVIILALLSASGASAAEKSKEETLDAAYEHLVKVMNPEEMKKLFALFDTMKDVGLSWNEDLLLPLRDIIACKTKEQLYVIWGMGSMNISYAMLFDKNPEGVWEGGREIDERIGFPRAELREESLAFAKSREGQASSSVDFIHAMLHRAKTDQAVLNTLVGGFYGSTLELFYLFSSLGLASGVTEEFVQFVNAHLPQLTIAQEMLKAYSENRELAQLLDTENRKSVIDSIVGIITKEMGKLTEDDLKQIFSIVKAIRDPLVAPCN